MQTITPAFNTATVRKGEVFEIEVLNHAGAGYLWQFNILAGQATDLGVAAEHKPFDPATTPIGGQTHLRHRFRANEAGTIIIRGEENQPFDTSNILQKCVFRIDVI